MNLLPFPGCVNIYLWRTTVIIQPWRNTAVWPEMSGRWFIFQTSFIFSSHLFGQWHKGRARNLAFNFTHALSQMILLGPKSCRMWQFFSLSFLFFKCFFAFAQNSFNVFSYLLVGFIFHINQNLFSAIEVEAEERRRRHVPEEHDLHPGVFVLDLGDVEKHKLSRPLARFPRRVVVHGHNLHGALENDIALAEVLQRPPHGEPALHRHGGGPLALPGTRDGSAGKHRPAPPLRGRTRPGRERRCRRAARPSPASYSSAAGRGWCPGTRRARCVSHLVAV